MRCPTPLALQGGSKLVPCGKCKVCLKRLRDDETMRCLWEIEAASAAWFFTGTFEGASPDRKEAQRSWKMFRERLGKRFPLVEFRFLRVPEFGSRHGRFHWHAIMVATYSDGAKPVRVDDLDDAWRQGQGSEGFAKVKVLKGAGRNTSDADRRRLARYVVKYLRHNPGKGAKEAKAVRKEGPNVARSPHFGETGVERFVASRPVLAEIATAFPGFRIAGVYERVSPLDGLPVSVEEAAEGIPSIRRKLLYVPGSHDPLKPRPYERVGAFGRGVDVDDLMEAERLRRAQYPDERDDPNRLVAGKGFRPVSGGQRFNSQNLDAAKSARLGAQRKSWWSASESAATRAAFAASLSTDEGFAHVHSLEEEESNHWFGDDDPS